MDDHSFCQMAVDSAQRYLQYLKDNDKGLIVTEVSRIDKGKEEVSLYLRGRISPVGLESLKLRVYANEYDPWEIHPVEYQIESSVLTLRPREDIFNRLPHGKCKGIAVISDLRFLVERVREWYRNKCQPITLPAEAPNIPLPTPSDMAGGAPTEEQYSTVCNVLTHSFTYVWGAPGTGKTRFVLANCVMAYLRQGKQVLLTAPTNNALDQMLSGVLDVLHTCGIPDSHAFRFGVPSAGFSKKYPDACEQRSVERRRASLIEKLKNLRQQYGDALLYEKIRSDLSQAAALMEQFNTIYAEYQTATVSEQDLSTVRTAAEDAQNELDDLENTIQELTIWLDSFPGKLSRFFRPGIYSEKTVLLKASARNLDTVTQAYKTAAQQLSIYEERAQAASQRYLAQLESLKTQFIEVFPEPLFPEFFLPAHMPILDFPARLQLAYSAIKNSAEQLPPPSNTDIDQIRKSFDDAKAQLEKLNTGVEERWANVKVWAMTIDRFISLNEVPSGFTPSHIFMDEAAYCSLIKGYTLLSLNRPVTLLGDHAQLPPVCEMSEHVLNREFCPEFLWAQSAIHLDAVFHKPELDLYEDYRNAAPPSFFDLQLNTLSITHRFGPSLSRVLSDFIYNHGLTSANSEETSVKVIHAPASAEDVKRTSRAECAAIYTLAKELFSKGIDFAILTPYKKQVAMLAKLMPHRAAAGQIMTVHAAQGREFHTVILSVVDTTDKFFVASGNPIGRAVLNTAISRVKSDLILVLDAEYWRAQEKELIGQLMQV